MEPVLILVVIAVIAGFYLAFNIGANDVANTMGTSVGSQAMSIKQAIVLAAICEFLGALLIGDEVSRTIKQGFVSPTIFAADPYGFALGMTGAILATSLWLQFATFRGLPVSTTHSIVGAVLGFAIMRGGWGEINFSQLGAIFSSWLISPILGGIIAFLCLRFILRFIIDSNDPIGRSKKIVPFMIGSAVIILSSAFTPKLIKKVLDNYVGVWGIIASILLGLLVAFIFHILIEKISPSSNRRDELLILTEKIFAKMQFVTACFLAFAHGSNDVANAIGPASAVISALVDNSVNKETHVPLWLLLVGGVGIVIGLAIFGRKVIQTVGKNITEITPTRGFAAEFSAALTILLGTILGLPLSTTHVLVGAVIGVGFARGIGGIDVLVIKRIARSWIVTMPVTAVISMIFCFFLQRI
ncbi:MAG: inorganic phosphate transporter [Myxococcales bacterium]|nr:inorganic phosphate transporter [Myxococcales bacterium]USN50627.1 MAG: inorganic phosphate transporter [Myxococcales bacterium]